MRKYMNKSESLPLMGSAALAIGLSGSLEVAADITDNLPGKAFEFGLGMDSKISESLLMNAGVIWRLSDTPDSSGMPFKLNAGVGFSVSDFMINYAFAPMAELGSIQRMTLAFKYGTAPKAKGKKAYRASSTNKKNSPDLLWRLYEQSGALPVRC